uniref:Tetratricopeptide repeat protein n=1 Tax=Panagrolaimus sp. PS1159 TaxID=55785 RepID=A0AC35GI33_9BILA
MIRKKVRNLNEHEPEPRPHRNPDEEQIRWNLILLDLESESGSHCCKTPFKELKPIKLCEMKVPMIHRGKYLVCKVAGKPCSILGIAKPFPLIGVKILIQDLNGDVEEASIFNFPLKPDEKWLCLGTILFIKEPWLQYISESKTPFIRIEFPSDVIFVDPADEEFLIKIGAEKWYISMSKDAKFWRTKANECYKNGKTEEALFLYERGIRCDPENAGLYLNKSAACLKMGSFYMAFKAAETGLEKGGNREKALFRMGQAKYGMREWQKAADYFLKVLNEFPNNISASAQFKRRGIIATTDIKEGTLLIVSKPFASGYKKDFPKNLMSIMPGNPTLPQHILQVINAMQNLQNNPEQAKEFYKLYAGD